MKKVFITFLFLSIECLFSQVPMVQWDKTIGGNSTDFIKNVLKTPLGYLVLGYSNSPVSADKTVVNGVANTNDVWALNMDTNFNIMSQNSYKHANPNSLLHDFDSYVFKKVI